MGFIDAHVHLWTDDTAHYPIAPGWKKEDMKDLGVSCQAFEEDAGPPPRGADGEEAKEVNTAVSQQKEDEKWTPRILLASRQ